jgi:hypothetical protein
MRFFRRKEVAEPVDPNARSPELGLRYADLAVLKQLIDHGAVLTESRHVVYYTYVPSGEVATAMAREAEAHGFSAEVRDPLPQNAGEWSLVCETHAVTSPDFVRGSDDFFHALADRHGADYDGWEASV